MGAAQSVDGADGNDDEDLVEDVSPVWPSSVRSARASVLMQALSAVLEAKLANGLGDVRRSDRAIERACGALMDLL
jgi:predicted sugar kinase